MESKQVTRNKLTRSDLIKLGLLSIFSQSGFSFERMQSGGFTGAMAPALEKIYGKQKDEIAKAMTNNMGFINTEPHMITFLQGLILSLEESGENRDLILNLRTGLFGPLAGLGDAIFWFTLLPISAAISTSLSNQGSVFGPILFMIIWFIAALSRIWFGMTGYRLGINSLDVLRENGEAITKSAGILGVMVIGGLIPAYVNFAFPETLVLFDTVPVQEIFDVIMPNLLPFAIVMAMVALFRKRQVSVITIILGTILIAIALAFLGIM